MSKPKLISPISKQTVGKLKVAPYCRVSTSSADQLNSYATQIDYYTKYFKKKPEWELVEIFADEGLSGTKAENRSEFQRMITMCEHHLIDIIITKSVSRFARNVKEALEYVRKLKLLGIGVIFEKEGINTLTLGDEMLLNTFAAIAQEESKAISQNVRLSIRKQMELGEYVASNAPFGYRRINNRLEIYEPEAEIVRYVFESYLNGKSTSAIAYELTARGIPTKCKLEKWKPQNVGYMLTNEKYVGDAMCQKTWRTATVPFKQFRNLGQEDMYYASNTHDAIIDRDTFGAVQELAKKRKEQFGRTQAQNIYPLTSHIRCAECGSSFYRKVRKGGIKWVCSKHAENSFACDSYYYSEERIYDGLISVVNKLRFGQENILTQVIAKLEYAVNQYKRNNKAASQISQSIAEINAMILKLNELRSKGYLDPAVHETQVRELQKQLNSLKDERQSEFETGILDMLQEVRKLKSLIEEIEEPLETFDERLFYEILKEISIDKHDDMHVTLIGNLTFTEQI